MMALRSAETKPGETLAHMLDYIRFEGTGFGSMQVRGTVNNGAEIHLLTDGKAIYLEDSDRRIVDILKSARQPMISVCVSDQIRRLTAAASLPPKRAARAEAGPAQRRDALDRAP